jgi:CheY-like chemotaxis protein
MKIDLALSGPEAIQKIKDNCYDLAFMDHMMPDMDGVEATKRIREFNGSLPIIALTANAVSGTKEMFLSNGFNDFLSKPIDVIKLDAVLKKWIPKEKQEKSTEKIKNSNQRNPQIIAAFCKDGAQKIEELRKCLETDNYSLYTTHVHGLKSAAANAGESELSELAKKLETAGKNGDFAFIKEHSEPFLAALQKRLSSINEVLQANRKESSDLETLKTELLKLRDVLRDFDFAAFSEIANVLRDFPQAENILQSALVGEYEEAISAIDALLSPRQLMM